jgi:hypothetical protein
MSHRREGLAPPFLKQPGGSGNTKALNTSQTMRLSKIVESSPLWKATRFGLAPSKILLKARHSREHLRTHDRFRPVRERST